MTWHQQTSAAAFPSRWAHAVVSTSNNGLLFVGGWDTLGTQIFKDVWSVVNLVKAPDPVAWAMAATNSATSVSLSWIAPPSPAAVISGYRVLMQIGSGPFAVYNNNTNSVSTSLVVSGLRAGQHYSFRVAAINVFGVGALSVPSSVTLPAGLCYS